MQFSFNNQWPVIQPKADFLIPFSSNGLGGFSFSRTSADTTTDFEDNIVSVPAGTIAFRGGVWDGSAWSITDSGTPVHPTESFTFTNQATSETATVNRLAHYEAWVGATTAVSLGKKIAPGDGTYWECTTAGTTGGSEPTWTPNTVTDGSVEWTYKGLYQDEIGLQISPAAKNLVECFSFPLADELQSNIATNGTFDTDTNWNKEPGWTIGSGVATKAAGSAGSIYLDGDTIVEGRVYEVTFDTVGVTSGTIYPFIGGTAGTGRGTNGTFTEEIIAGSNGIYEINFFADATFAGSIDNVVVKEVKHAIGTKATTASSTAIEGFAVSGESTGYLHIRAATQAEENKYGQLTGWASKMYEGVNTDGGAAARFVIDADDDDALNLTPHAVTVYASGAGDVGLVAVAGQTSITSTLQRYEFLGTVTGAGNGHRIRVNVGGSVAFAIPQLEESAFSTPAILTDTTAGGVSRVASDVGFSGFSENDVTLFLDLVIKEDLSSTVYIFGDYTNSSNYVRMSSDTSGDPEFRKVISGSSYASGGSPGDFTQNNISRVAGVLSSSAGVSMFIDGAKGANTNANTTDAVLNAQKLGQRGASALFSYILLKNIIVASGVDSDANNASNTSYD